MKRTALFFLGWYAIVFLTLMVGLLLDAPAWLIGVTVFVGLLSFGFVILRRTVRGQLARPNNPGHVPVDLRRYLSSLRRRAEDDHGRDNRGGG